MYTLSCYSWCTYVLLLCNIAKPEWGIHTEYIHTGLFYCHMKKYYYIGPWIYLGIYINLRYLYICMFICLYISVTAHFFLFLHEVRVRKGCKSDITQFKRKNLFSRLRGNPHLGGFWRFFAFNSDFAHQNLSLFGIWARLSTS